MKKYKQVVAIVGIVLLVLMYIVCFILAIFVKGYTVKWFNVSAISNIIIPIFIWVSIWIAKLLSKNK